MGASSDWEKTWDHVEKVDELWNDAKEQLDEAFSMPDFTPDVPELPEFPKPPEVKEKQAEIKAAVDQQRKKLRAARGRSSTILTRGSGGETLGEPLTRRKTILGS